MGMYENMKQLIATGEHIIKDETITLEQKEILVATLLKEFNCLQETKDKDWEVQEEWA